MGKHCKNTSFTVLQQTKVSYSVHLNLIQYLFISLRFLINLQKSHKTPAQRMMWRKLQCTVESYLITQTAPTYSSNQGCHLFTECRLMPQHSVSFQKQSKKEQISILNRPTLFTSGQIFPPLTSHIASGLLLKIRYSYLPPLNMRHNIYSEIFKALQELQTSISQLAPRSLKWLGKSHPICCSHFCRQSKISCGIKAIYGNQFTKPGYSTHFDVQFIVRQSQCWGSVQK